MNDRPNDTDTRRVEAWRPGTGLVAGVIALLISLLAVSTAVAASTYAYDDAPSTERAEDHAFKTSAASSTRRSDAPEVPASRSVEAPGTPGTPDARSVATEAASPGGKAIVIGEDMEGRVIPKANDLGADYYDPPTAPRDQWMENNRKWINDRMDEGCTIYDCGPAPGRANYPNPTSPYYQMELSEIAKRPYPVVRLT